MKDLIVRRRAPLAVFVLILCCAALITASFWRAAAFQVKKDQSSQDSSQVQRNQRFYEQIRKGLGSEVKFAAPKASSEQVRASVASVTRFIYNRSGLGMGEKTKARLTELEQSTLNDALHRISIDKFTNALTDTSLVRLATITDQEIDRAAQTFQADPDGYISLRATGGYDLTVKEFIDQMQTSRDASRRNDKELRETVYAILEPLVKERVTYLSAALPEQFGQASIDGITPLQAFMVAYSIAADDLLSGSHSDLHKQIVALTRDSVKTSTQKIEATTEKAYGVNGYYSTPLDLILTEQVVGDLLNRIEKGGARDE